MLVVKSRKLLDVGNSNPKFKVFLRTLITLTCFTVSQSLTFLSPTLLHAVVPSDPAKITIGDWEEICQKHEEIANDKKDSNNLKNVSIYCSAAWSAKEGEKNNKILLGLWSTVLGICGTSCLLSKAFPVEWVGVSSKVCIGSSITTTVTDTVMNKNYETLIQSAAGNLMQLGMMYRMSSSAKPAADAAKGTSEGAKASSDKSVDWGSCIAAAMAGFQVYVKKSGIDACAKSAIENLRSAAKFRSLNAAKIETTEIATPSSPAQGGSLTRAISNLATGNISSQSDISAGGWPGLVSSAIAVDSNLPSGLSDPSVPSAFQKLTGMDLNSFMKSDQDPKQSMMAAMGGGLDSDQMSKLSSTLDQLKDFSSQELQPITPTSSAYAAGGGSGSGSGTPEEDPMAAMMANMMAQFMPGATATGQNQQRLIQEIDFSKKLKANPSIETDKTVDLFERVSHRYARFEVILIKEGIKL